MCWGGGHDLCTNRAGQQWSNLGHDYQPSPTRGGYTSNAWKSWFSGVYQYNAKNEGDLYEVYIVK